MLLATDAYGKVTPRIDKCLGIFYLIGGHGSFIPSCSLHDFKPLLSIKCLYWPITCQHDCYGGGERNCQGCLGHRKRTSYVASPPRPTISGCTLYYKPALEPLRTIHNSTIARATREQMSEARLPLQYRDSCAHLLIPLNRCRFEEYYLPWKCVVCEGYCTRFCSLLTQCLG